MKRATLTFGIALSVFALLAITANASQTIHFQQDFTDNSIADEIGSVNGLFAGLGYSLQPQQSWRGGASVSYYGPSGSVAFNPPTGYGAGGAPPAGNSGLGFGGYFGASVVGDAGAGVGKLATGNVWVVDMKMISDMAGTNDNPGALQNSPGFAVEVADFTTFGDDGLVVATKATNVGSTFAVAYPNGADGAIEPDALPAGHSAALSTALNSEIHAKYVFQSAPTGGDNAGNLSTRVSVQTLNAGGAQIGTGAHYDGSSGAGNFRTDYSAGIFVQLMNNHGTGNVTYASGVTGLTGGSAAKVDVAYNDAENAGNLQLGLTHLTFKQVRQSDFNTDGVVNVSGDGSKLVANLGLSGKSFFDGDANGDGTVNVSGDGSKLVAQLGTDILGSGQGLAEYNPATGQVLISTNGAGFIEINSSLSQLIGANAVPTNTAGLNALISDPFTSSVVNYLNFSPLGTAGILDDFSIGAILPTGISDPSGFVPGATFRWSVVGGGEFQAGVHIIPEPGSVILAGFAGLGLVVAARRFRRSLAK
jgi:hypothetical protein